MKLTPLDIQHMEFPTGLNGYPKKQVKEFLERVAGELEDALRENQNLRDEMKKREAQISDLQASEAELKRVVIAAERIANEIRENAKREAELAIQDGDQRRRQALSDAETRSDKMLSDAERKRQEILDDAENRVREARAELLRLEREQRLFREQFRALLQAFARNLEAGPLATGPQAQERARQQQANQAAAAARVAEGAGSKQD